MTTMDDDDSNSTSRIIQNPYLKSSKRPRVALGSESCSVGGEGFVTATSPSDTHGIGVKSDSTIVDDRRRNDNTSTSNGTTTTSTRQLSDGVKVSSCGNAVTPSVSETTASSAQSSSSSSSAEASASALIISAADKAGMDGIDRTRIDEIILRESGDSAYMLQQKKRDAKVNERIEAMKRRLQTRQSESLSTTGSTNQAEIEKIDDRLAMYQRRQKSSRSTCLVMDMDMFYMACELLSRPDLTEKPACVGRGMILTSNYVARRYGVRSAMPGFIGDKLVQELSGGREKLIHVPSNFDLYKAKANIVRDVLRQYDPNMRSYSLDEAYLDIGPYIALYLQKGSSHMSLNNIHQQIVTELQERHDPTNNDSVVTGSEKIESEKDNTSNRDHNGDEGTNKGEDHKVSQSAVQILQSYSSLVCMDALDKIVAALRMQVKEATGGLTCSVGVGPNFSIAKIASDMNKPNGQCLVPPTDVIDFVHPLPVRKVPGIGRVTEKVLQHVCGVKTVRDLYEKRHLVEWLWDGGATASFLLRASVGCSSSMVSSSDFGAGGDEDVGVERNEASSASSSGHQKGISRERTFSPDDSWVSLNTRLEDISRLVFDDMERKGIMTHTVTVKVKLRSFDVLSRAYSLPKGTYVENAKDLVDIAAQVFSQIRSNYFEKMKDTEDSKQQRRQFVVRLLGIRCSNLIDKSSFRCLEAGRLDKFLQAKPNENGVDATATHKTNKSIIAPLKTSPKRSPTRATTSIMDMLAASYKPSTSIEREQVKPSLKSSDTTDTSRKEGETTHDTEITTNAHLAQKEQAFCPMCNRGFAADDNYALNAHIDSCLNSEIVREAVKEENSSSRKRQLTTHQLTDYFRRLE